MKAVTRLFGTIDVADEKIITMERGMIGFPNLTHFALIFDEEKKDKKFKIMWLQSMDDGDIAFPVADPIQLKEDYKPLVNEEIIAPLGEMTEDNTYILVTVTVPKKVEDFSVNLKAPIVINMDSNKGAQIITEDDYPVKFRVYDLLKGNTEKAGE
ncbi:MAG: flagellar assembly protein FliW [Agathobacter sp.]|nr:flagellar assembly protein FliW [Agathobacter sp.]MBQ3558739.1 flagellar assembly protein FliW [Agathobacter sp.]